MNSSFKALGRKIEIVTVVLLVFAVAYLFVKIHRDDSIPGSAHGPPPVVESNIGDPSDQSSVTCAAAVETPGRQTGSATRSDAGPPGEPRSPKQEMRPATSMAGYSRACHFDPVASNAESRPISACEVTFRIATAMPEVSQWMQELRAAAKTIKDKTGGRVNFTFRGSGMDGTQSQVLNKIKIGVLQGGDFTASAFQGLYSDLGVYDLPFLFESMAEVDYIRNLMDERLTQGMNQLGFVTFGFAGHGFAYLMSDRPVSGRSDFEGLRTWVPEGDAVRFASSKALSLSPIVLPLGDVYSALQLQKIDAIGVSPSGALLMQWHTKVRYLTDLPFVFTFGFLAIDAKAFAKLNDADRQIVCMTMRDAIAELEVDNYRDNLLAKESLLEAGMKPVMVAADESKAIRELAEQSNRRLAEQGLVSKQFYEEVLSHLAAYRSRSSSVQDAQ
jgi:TRAP-type transport system periplasmic protein